MERKPSVVGLTVYVTNYEASVLLAKAIKRVAPHVIVVFGRPTPSVQATNILQNIEEVDRHIKDYLDKFPSPYLSGILPVTNNAGVLTARGCNQNCTYCNCAVLSSRSILTHSVDRVIDELEYISQAGMPPNEEIQIFDDAFTHHF